MLQNILNKFNPISLEELDKVKLLNRTDTKFVLGYSTLESILESISDSYDILCIENQRTNDYRTLYFDYDNFELYNKHHRGFVDRYKVRIRKYLDSDLCFLEIKHKIKGRTDKRRIRINDFEENLSAESLSFISENSNLDISQLKYTLYNQFTRITLAHKSEQERVTVDLNLSFENNEVPLLFEHLVIAEVKQERVNMQSDIIIALKKHGVRPDRISKYCVGSLLLYPQLKYNNFKSKVIKIAKLHGKSFSDIKQV